MMNVEDEIRILKDLLEGILNEYKRTLNILGNLNQRIGELEDEFAKRTDRPH